jgi:hypothetical protein
LMNGLFDAPITRSGVRYRRQVDRTTQFELTDKEGIEVEMACNDKYLAISVAATGAAPEVPLRSLVLPRLAVLQTWYDTQSAGWVRMILDDEKIPYTLIMDDDVKRGSLQRRFDVILFPDTEASLKDIIGGIDPRHSPLAYTRTPEYPSHGTPTSSPDITGGLTWKGVSNLEEFVRAGGIFVTLGGASTLPLDGGIARNVRRVQTKELYTPGSHLRATFADPSHPLAFGYGRLAIAFRQERALYDVRQEDEASVVLRFGKADGDDDDSKGEDLVASGGIKGASEIDGKPAILDLAVGKGRVIAFDFDPFHRYATPAAFRLVWNAVLNWNALDNPGERRGPGPSQRATPAP